MFLTAPVLHDEAACVRVEEEAFRVPRSRRSQIDEENDGELETFG
jgi:hypothetical protein